MSSLLSAFAKLERVSVGACFVQFCELGVPKMLRTVMTAAAAAAAAAASAPELPSAFASLVGSDGGFHRVVGDAGACPNKLQLTSDWVVHQPGFDVPFIRKPHALVELFVPASTGEEKGRCAFVTLHMLPAIKQAATGSNVETVREQVVVGKLLWNTTDPRCIPDKSPSQTRVTLMTKSLVDSVEPSMVPHMNLTTLRKLFGEGATRMMFYRNSEVEGKLKNCVYVDGKGEAVEEKEGLEKLFTDVKGMKMRPALEMFVRSLLFGKDRENKVHKHGKDNHEKGKRGEGKKIGEGEGSDDDTSGVDETDPGLMALGGSETRDNVDRETSESSDSNCFPGDATVGLEDGTKKRMDELIVGDRVAVGGGHFSDVFMFTHKLPTAQAEFITLTTASGSALMLTPGHYIPLSIGELVAARSVRVGDSLILGDGDESRVVSARFGSGVGLFNPQTTSGDVVVNGVLASTYTQAVEPAVAHAALAPLRMLYHAFGVSSSALADGAPVLAQRVPKGLRGL